MPTFYAVQVSKEGLAGELRINDVPLYNWLDRKPVTTGQPVNMWITGHTGKLTLAYDWRNAPPGNIVPSPKLTLKILSGSQRNQPMRGAFELAHSEWRLDPKVPARPPGVALDFPCHEIPPSVFWPEARALDISPEAKANVLALLHDLNAALDRRDIQRVSALLQFKTLDVGRSFYHSDSESMNGLSEYLAFCMDGPDWSMESVDDASVQFQTVADGRLIWATLPDAQPVLQSRANRHPRLQLPVYAAPVRGSWTVVR
jgi:hypothetical protein